MPAQQRQLRAHRVPHRIVVAEQAAARRQKDHRRTLPVKASTASKTGSGFSTMPAPPPYGRVIHRVVPVVRVVAQLHHAVVAPAPARPPVPGCCRPAAPSNHSGNSVTTLIVSIGLVRQRDEVIPPRLDRGPARDALRIRAATRGGTPGAAPRQAALQPRAALRPPRTTAPWERSTAPGFLTRGNTATSPCSPCGLRSRPTTRGVCPTLRPS